MIVLAVDAGASRTRVALWRDETFLGMQEGSAGGIRPGRVLHSAATIASLAKSVLARASLIRADVVVAGAAGAGRAQDAEELRAALRGEQLAERVVVTTDVAIALAALPPGPAGVLIAGTGSIAIARLGDGTIIQRGGYGWQMSDEGSGYWIGKEALTAIARSNDGRGPRTALEQAVMAATGTATFRDLVGWATVALPREVATLAATVVAAAEGGDEPSARILDRAAEHLGELAASLGTRDPLHLSGGLFKVDEFRRRVLRELERRELDARPEPVDPLSGAVALARAAAQPR